MVHWEGPLPVRPVQAVRCVGIGAMTKRKNKRPKTKPLRYFFYRGDLHKKIHINRPNDTIVAWNYPKGKVERYVYSDVRKNGGQAFYTGEVAKMVNRHPITLRRAMEDGMIREPQQSYGLDEERNPYAYFWSEKDIMELHDYLKTVHYGRPRKDGLTAPLNLPTAAELRAMIRQGTVFYVKEGDKFVPTWKAESI